ncbi:MAG: STAS domain-containing protein [Treponemataceae bacterium]
MELHTSVIDEKTCVISASGRLNAVSASELKNEIKTQVASGHTVLVIDLKETPFIDSSGLSALVSGLKLTREQGGSLRLSGLNEQTSTVFKLTLLDRVFQIFPDVEQALGR